MKFDGNVIFLTCATVAVLVVLFFLVYYIVTAKNMKKRRAALIEHLDSMKAGKEVLFSGGIKGKILKAGDEYLTVEVSKGIELTISRLAVSEVLNSKKETKKDESK